MKSIHTRNIITAVFVFCSSIAIGSSDIVDDGVMVQGIEETKVYIAEIVVQLGENDNIDQSEEIAGKYVVGKGIYRFSDGRCVEVSRELVEIIKDELSGVELPKIAVREESVDCPGSDA